MYCYHTIRWHRCYLLFPKTHCYSLLYMVLVILALHFLLIISLLYSLQLLHERRHFVYLYYHTAQPLIDTATPTSTVLALVLLDASKLFWRVFESPLHKKKKYFAKIEKMVPNRIYQTHLILLARPYTPKFVIHIVHTRHLRSILELNETN